MSIAPGLGMRSSLPAFVLVFAAPALAQTYIVDGAMGPGANFPSIDAAVNAVPDGAVIRVRPGTYRAFGIPNKSLKVLADPGVVVTHSLTNIGGSVVTVSGLQTDKSVVLSGLTLLTANPSALVYVTLSQCAGSLLLDRVEGWGSHVVLQATGCDRLLLRNVRSSVLLRCELTSCNAVAELSAFGQGPTVPSAVSGTPIVVSGGTLQLMDCTVQSPNGFFSTATHGMVLQGGAVRVLGNTTLNGSNSSVFAVTGTGVVRLAPTATVGVPSFGPNVTATTLVMPAASTTFAGSQITARVAGAPGHIAVLSVALPGPLVSLPGTDPIWLDGASWIPLGGTVLGASPFVVQLPWTSGLEPAVRAVFQGATFDAVTGLAISNPSFVLLP
jgi:hypothetical protein